MVKILIVDDSATSRLLFRAYMPKDVVCEIHEADDIATALEVAARVRPQVTVLDFNMPEHNGVEVGEALKVQGFEGALVLLTANTQQSVLQAAQRAGFSAVIEKPITADKIEVMLRDLF